MVPLAREVKFDHIFALVGRCSDESHSYDWKELRANMSKHAVKLGDPYS